MTKNYNRGHYLVKKLPNRTITQILWNDNANVLSQKIDPTKTGHSGMTKNCNRGHYLVNKLIQQNNNWNTYSGMTRLTY